MIQALKVEPASVAASSIALANSGEKTPIACHVVPLEQAAQTLGAPVPPSFPAESLRCATPEPSDMSRSVS